MTSILTLITIVFFMLSSLTTLASDNISREDLIAWIASGDALPPPQAGKTLGAGDDAIMAFLPPGYANEYNFPGVRLEIQTTTQFEPHQTYVEASAVHNGTARLAADGALLNYVAGRPFDPSLFEKVTPEEAGFMLAWNHVHRWQYYGWLNEELTMYYIQPASNGRNQLRPGFSGGGHIDRYISLSYQRVYLSHLAMLSETEYKIDLKDGGGYFFKDHMLFHEPFDVKGTEFVIERATDPHELDQINSYLPTERRVRRLSAKERADRFMGSDMTMDDFEGFSGQILHYKWRYLGSRRLLAVVDSKAPTIVFFGPESRVANDEWQLRPTYAVEIVSTWHDHPYSSRILFIDAETYNVTTSLAFNREGQMWRMNSLFYWLPEPGEGGLTAIETSLQRLAGTTMIDRLSGTSTVSRMIKPTQMPSLSVAEIKRRFSVSALTGGR